MGRMLFVHKVDHAFDNKYCLLYCARQFVCIALKKPYFAEPQLNSWGDYTMNMLYNY